MHKKLLILAVLVSLLFLAACGGGDDTAEPSGGDSVGDVARGETLYNSTTVGANNAPGCVTCHSLEPGVTLVGPSHAGVGSNSEAYLRESIVDPNADIIDGFTAGVMYQNYKNDLTEQEIADLVAYLLTLK